MKSLENDKSLPNLTMDQVKQLLWKAEEQNPRDYLILRLMAMFDLSVGEVVGSDPRGWNKDSKTWYAKEPDILGLMIEAEGGWHPSSWEERHGEICSDAQRDIDRA